MTVDLTKLAFHSNVNYMKRSTFCGSASLALPAHLGTVSTTITHNLGYIPFFQVAADLDASSTIWTDKFDVFTDSSSSSDTTDPQLVSWATTTTLVIQLVNSTTPTATGTRNVYYIIYLDYGNI